MPKPKTAKTKSPIERNSPCCMCVPRNVISEKAVLSGDDCRTESMPMLESDALFSGCREIVIRHGEQEYRLRITKQNKLILTK